MTTYTYKTQPMAHQVEGLNRLIANDGVLGLLWEPGCLQADADLVVNRGGASFHISIERLYRKMTNSRWRMDIPTMIQRASENGTVRLAEVIGVFDSGVKTTYTVTTSTGRALRATADHPFMTDEGWKPLSDLREGDRVQVNGGRSTRGSRGKKQYKDTYVNERHPRARRSSRGPSRPGAPPRWRIGTHRLVMEAHLNGMTKREFINLLRSDLPLDTIRFLTPSEVVHHRNGDHTDNRIENLELTTPSDHAREHAGDFGNHVLEQLSYEEVTSILEHGEEKTFDLAVKDDPHNFIANGFVVHNTGKSKAVIDYLGVMTQAKGTFLALVLAPLSAVDTWSDEIDKHLPDHIERTVVMLRGSIASKAKQLTVAVRDRGPGLTLIVTNHDVLSSSATVAGTKTVTNRQRMGDAIRGAGLDILVVDESHRAKGHSSNLSRSLGALSSAAPRRVIMTGTVAPHSPLDLFGQWRFLNPRRFGTVWNDFRERYATMGGFRGKQVIGYRHLDEMNRLAAMDSMTVRRRDVLDLPPVTENVIHVHLTPAEARAYKAMAKDMVIDHTSDGQPLLASTGLVKWLRLRQLTSGHYTDAEHHKVEHFGSSKVRMCVDKVSDLVAAGEKVVVFAHFRDDVFRTAETLRATLKGSAVVEHITGDTLQDERKAIRKTFLNHDGPVVVVAQMRTVSLAVNEFVVARHAIFMSMSERRDDWVQAKDRLDRNGQTRPVTLHYLVVPDSIDEVVLDTHRTKGRLEDAVVRNADRIKTLGESDE